MSPRRAFVDQCHLILYANRYKMTLFDRSMEEDNPMAITLKRQAAMLLLLALIVPMLIACGASGPTGGQAGATAAPAATAAPEVTAAVAEPTAAPAAGGATDLASLSGDINIDGSSTVEPLTLAVAEEFARVAPNVNITVGRSGTGGGFEKFCNGETDANDASRKINDKETEACTGKNVTPVELFLGLDGLAVVVNPENDFVKGLSFEQLKQIYVEGGATTWDQVDPAFPAEKIDKYGPDADSGTLDYFKETLKLRGAESKEDTLTGDYTASADDNTLVQGVEGSKYAIGFFGYAFYEQQKDKLKVVPLTKETGKEPVAPSPETVEGGTYPFSRPLFVYPSKDVLKAKPQLAAFLTFYLDNVKDIIGDAGYFPGADDRYAEAKKNLADALK
jgi:phosphate transport system substrate-binding protein